MIRAEQLTRRFGGLLAVDHIDFSVAPGRIYGFLGPNGAGKTTTIKMLVGLLRPTFGRALIGGHDIVSAPLAAKALIGYVPDQPSLPEKLTGREFLEYVAGLHRLDPADARRRGRELFELFDLGDRERDLIAGYSHGMRQKTALAGALLPGPSAIFLDEPTVGLDPRSARRIKNILRDLADDGAAILMSTHILEIAEAMCDSVGIVSEGRLLVSETVADLRARPELSGSLEDIFLQLTGGAEERAIADEIRNG